MELREIDLENYEEERDEIFSLVGKMWTRQESLANVKHSIERWGTSKKESGSYFYILNDGEIIGITGYYVINENEGKFGLRHHGTTIKGSGKPALDILITEIGVRHTRFKELWELIPEGREDLIPIFESWGFKEEKSDMDWEPKKDYYKYALVRRS